MKRTKLIQLNTGLGAGNVGDELMAQEFWKLLPPRFVLEVPLLGGVGRYRGTYPPPHRYYDVASPKVSKPGAPGLMVGDTPVGEFEGLQYPLGVVGPYVSAFTAQGFAVDAVSVGVDRLHTHAGRELFAAHYAAIRTWTVRTNGCREALLDLGVASDRIRVAADLAWNFVPGDERDEWARQVWQQLGVEAGRPLLVVNLTHHTSPEEVKTKRVVARALDELVRRHSYQVAFLCNETRPDPQFDHAAAVIVQREMAERAVIVPNEYYTPLEMVSLLRSASAVLSQRYHMAIEAILADTIPVCILRGQKIAGLAEELRLISCSLSETTDPEDIVGAVLQSAARRPERLEGLRTERERLRARAATGLSFLEEQYPAVEPASSRRSPDSGIREIVITQLGGLGDVVLCSSLLGALRRRYAKARLTLFVREPFVALCGLFEVAPDAVIGVPFDPNRFTEPQAELTRLLGELESTVVGVRPDLFIAAELEPTWLSWYLAGGLQTAQNLACTPKPAPRGLLPILLHQSQRDTISFAGPAFSAEGSESERYAALAKAAGATSWRPPSWKLSTQESESLESFLAPRGLRLGEYAMCFPLGAASTPLKRWSPSSFVQALEAATEGFSLPLVLTGEPGDASFLEQMAAEMRERSATVHLFTNGPEDLALLSYLMAGAKFFLGNDTGPGHLAQAYGTPGALVFGGGNWPHYRPWGRGTVGVVFPLPCFGCGWDCAFGRPYCVEGITVEVVVAAVHQAREYPQAEGAIRSLTGASPELVQLAGATSERYQLAQRDRLARYHALVETQYANASHRQLLERMSAPEAPPSRAWAGLSEVDQRLLQIDQRLAAGAASARTLVVGDDLRQATTEQQKRRLEELELRFAETAETAHQQAALLKKLDQMHRESSSNFEEANRAAVERLELVERVSKDLGEARREAELRLVALREANQLLATQQAELDELRNQLSGSTVLVNWQNQRLAELEHAASTRLQAIEEANALLRTEQLIADAQKRELGSLQGQWLMASSGLEEQRAAAEERLRALQEISEELSAARKTAADRLLAIEEANRQLSDERATTGRLQQRTAELAGELTLAQQRLEAAEPAAAERLVALEEVNALFAEEQAESEALRQQIARLTGELTLAQQRLEAAEPAAAERLVALEEVNTLFAQEQAESEALRQRVARLTGELTLAQQRLEAAEPAAAERLVALEEVNALFAQEQAESEALRRQIAQLTGELTLATQRFQTAEPAAAERLLALEAVNALLAQEQANAEAQRRQIAELTGELTLAQQRFQAAEPAAAERLAALEQVNQLLAAEQATVESLRQSVAASHAELTHTLGRLAAAEQASAERLAALAEAERLYRAQSERLALFENAAMERLAALEATTIALHAEQTKRSALAADLQGVAQAQEAARLRQQGEREHWQTTAERLREALATEQKLRLQAEERAATNLSLLEGISRERDQLRRSVEELQRSENQLLNQALAVEAESLVQSVFRRFRTKS